MDDAGFHLEKGMPEKAAPEKYTKDDVLNILRRRIITMELAPGEPLDEVSLGQTYGLSRTPLREVLRHLSGEGYTQIRENKGAIVSPMDHKSMHHFFLAAPMIYSAISRLAAQSATPDQVDDLYRIQKHFTEATAERRVDDMVYFNDRFHHQIGEMADSPYLMPSLQRLLIDHARIGQTFWSDDTPHTSSPEHQDQSKIDLARAHHDQFIDIFAAHDKEAAVTLTLDHWALSRHYMELYIRPAPLDFDLNQDQGH